MGLERWKLVVWARQGPEGGRDVVPPAMGQQDASWVARWLPGGDGGALRWAWRGAFETVQLYPRAAVPRSGATLAATSLAPQAALAVEQAGHGASD